MLMNSSQPSLLGGDSVKNFEPALLLPRRTEATWIFAGVDAAEFTTNTPEENDADAVPDAIPELVARTAPPEVT